MEKLLRLSGLSLLLLVGVLSSCAVQNAAPKMRADLQDGVQRNEVEAAEVGKDSEPRARKQNCEAVAEKGKPGDYIIYKKKHVNDIYHFSVSIPNGLVGIAGTAGGHGIAIILSEQPEAVISVGAYFNAAELPSVEASVDSSIEYAEEYRALWLERLEREPTSLHKLPALRARIRYQDCNSGEIMIEESITAFRTVKNSGTPLEIEYTVSLTSPETRYAQDKAVFDAVVKSWRARRETE